MSPFYRKFFFFAFIALFVIIAPLLILYTAGYRYNFEHRKIQETGVLLVTYRPSDAILRLNGEIRSTASPARITGLVPGRYTITVTKDGHQPWEKKLWIEASQTTFAQHIVLWKTGDGPFLITEEPALLAVPSPDATLLAVVTTSAPRRITLLDTATRQPSETLTIPGATPTRITALQWSPRGRRLLITTNEKNKFIATIGNSATTPVALTTFTPTPLTRVQWNANDDDRLYGYTRSSTKVGYTLTELDLFRGATQTAAVPAMPKPLPYHVQDEILYRVEGDVLVINSFSAGRRALERRLALPEAPARDARFLPDGPESLLTLFDSAHKRLLLIDRNTRTLYPIQETIEEVRNAAWSPKKNRLIWNTSTTIGLLDLERSAREVLVEGIKKIQDIAWDPENEYVFYTVGENIRVREIDNRDTRNDAELAVIPKRKGLLVSHDGKRLYTNGWYNEKEQLLALTIADR